MLKSEVLNWARLNNKTRVVIKYKGEGVLLIENNTSSWHPLTDYKKLLRNEQKRKSKSNELIFYKHLLITTNKVIASEPPIVDKYANDNKGLLQWMKDNNILSGVFYFPNNGLYIVTPTEARWGISKEYQKERNYVRSLYR